MAPRKKKEITEQPAECTCAFPCGGTTEGCPSAPIVSEQVSTAPTTAAETSEQKLRNIFAASLMSGAGLHSPLDPAVVESRIRRCFDMADVAVRISMETK